jgi:hypothetical protein
MAGARRAGVAGVLEGGGVRGQLLTIGEEKVVLEARDECVGSVAVFVLCMGTCSGPAFIGSGPYRCILSSVTK